MKLNIPALPAMTSAEVFGESPKSPFIKPDANIPAWLPDTFPATAECWVESFIPVRHEPDNEDIVDMLGGEIEVYESVCVTPQQMRWIASHALVHPELFQTGRKDATLFFVRNETTKELFVMAFCFTHPDHERLLPTIYKVHSILRSWRTGVTCFKRTNN